MASERTATIEDFINSAPSNSISYDITSFLQKLTHITMVSYNVFNDYIDELLELSVTVTLSDQEFNRYQFRPKLLAYDIYGSTEVYFLIMILNNICNVKEFNFRSVKMLRVEDLEKVVSSIYNAEKYRLELNRTRIEESKGL